MSATKSPQEKKELSLKRDRRNTYGENSKSSRKSIRRNKQLSHMKVRRVAREVLGRLQGSIEESAADSAEASTKTKLKVIQQKSFKKVPDKPLGEVLERKRRRKPR